MKKVFLIVTLIALCPISVVAMENKEQITAERNMRIAQLQLELAQLQAHPPDNINAPPIVARRRTPVSMAAVQIQQPVAAPAAQRIMDNPVPANQQNNRYRGTGCCLLGTAGILVVAGAVGTAIWACIKYCPDPNENCIDNCNGNSNCIQGCKQQPSN